MSQKRDKKDKGIAVARKYIYSENNGNRYVRNIWTTNPCIVTITRYLYIDLMLSIVCVTKIYNKIPKLHHIPFSLKSFFFFNKILAWETSL